MTDASDQRLLEWAQSFRTPPSLELQGAKLDLDSYVAERRAVRLIVENSTPVITLKPSVRYINPVFELIGAPKNLASVALGNRPLKPTEYAWDGQTLWISANVDTTTALKLEFR